MARSAEEPKLVGTRDLMKRCLISIWGCDVDTLLAAISTRCASPTPHLQEDGVGAAVSDEGLC